MTKTLEIIIEIAIKSFVNTTKTSLLKQNKIFSNLQTNHTILGTKYRPDYLFNSVSTIIVGKKNIIST